MCPRAVYLASVDEFVGVCALPQPTGWIIHVRWDGMVKKSYLWAAMFTLVCAVISEKSSSTFSIVWDYVYSNPDTMTQGWVVRSEVVDAGRFGAVHFRFRYGYAVNDRLYLGSQISYGSNILPPYEMQRKYPEGKRIIVYYDSSRPRYSTLVKTSIGLKVYVHIISLALIFIVMSMLLRPLDYGS